MGFQSTSLSKYTYIQNAHSTCLLLTPQKRWVDLDINQTAIEISTRDRQR
jgi:hypothetical protein